MRHCSVFFFSSRRRHTRCGRDWSSDVCSSDLEAPKFTLPVIFRVSEKRTGNVNFGASVGQGTGLGGFLGLDEPNLFGQRSEERRVGKECRSRWWPYH